MTGADPRAVAVLRAFRRRHSLAQDQDAAIWARLQQSIADEVPDPVAVGELEAPRATPARRSWLVAAAVVLGIVSASAIASSVASPSATRSRVMQAVFELGGSAEPQTAVVRAQPSELAPTPAEPPVARAPLAKPSASDPADDSTTHRPRRPSATARASVDADALVVELGMIRRARRALQDGDHAAALALLDAHAHAFEHGQMVEDRMTLRVQALCAARSDAAAKAEADRASRRFPGLRRAFDPAAPCARK